MKQVLVDLHIHSKRSYDNRDGPSVIQIMDQANQLGLQGLAITDHNRLLPIQQFQNIARAYDMVLIPGIEITCEDGHLIVLNLEEEPPHFGSILEADAYLQDKDCFVIAAHPFDPIYGVNDLVYNLSIDAIEINGRRDDSINKLAKEVAADLGLPLIGSSDAHNLDDIGTKKTAISVEQEKVSDIIEALQNGNCRVI